MSDTNTEEHYVNEVIKDRTVEGNRNVRHIKYKNGFTLSLNLDDTSCGVKRHGVWIYVEVAVIDEERNRLMDLNDYDQVAVLSIEQLDDLMDIMEELPEDKSVVRRALPLRISSYSSDDQGVLDGLK
mgnify:FL=1